jgi:hypothetical protein
MGMVVGMHHARSCTSLSTLQHQQQAALSFGLLDVDHGDDDDDDAVVVCVGQHYLIRPGPSSVIKHLSNLHLIPSLTRTRAANVRIDPSNVNVKLYRYQQYQYQCRSIRHSKIIGIHSIVTVSESPPQK